MLNVFIYESTKYFPMINISNCLSKSDIEHTLSNLYLLTESIPDYHPFKRINYTIDRKNTNFDYLFDRCNHIFKTYVSEEHYIDELYILKFLPGHLMKLHTDIWNTERSSNRNYTLVIQLSEASSYTGAKTLIHLEDKVIQTSKEYSSGTLFKSELEHEVTLLESGERYSLVACFSKFRKKGLI